MDIKKIWLPIGAAFKKIMSALPDILVQVEKAAKDGVITADERKEVAMFIVDRLCEEWKFKPNFIVRIIISKIIDKLSKCLPPKFSDIKVAEFALKIAKEW